MELEKAKEIIRAAEENTDTAVPAALPHDKGWRHLGDDYFLSLDSRWACGPSGGDPTRTLAFIG